MKNDEILQAASALCDDELRCVTGGTSYLTIDHSTILKANRPLAPFWTASDDFLFGAEFDNYPKREFSQPR